LNDLLDLSLLESGKMNYNFQSGNLVEVIQQVANELRNVASERSLSFEVIYDPNVPVESFVGVFDSSRIGQVVRNLVSNAIKFSDQGTVIRITANPSSSGKMGFIVSNRGIGILESELDSIFDKFSQSSKTQTGAGGKGMGLAICKEIIEQHEGRIWAKSDPSGQTEFFVELP
ncbi:MAG: HAMP domain-containing sensor histidine kinase, partial [Bdellovibrionia bacterium]